MMVTTRTNPYLTLLASPTRSPSSLKTKHQERSITMIQFPPANGIIAGIIVDETLRDTLVSMLSLKRSPQRKGCHHACP
jgi:hypothetical protein